MATLTGKIIDVTSRPPDSISSITVKAPAARIGSGSDVIVSSPATVDFNSSTGDITISGLTGGLSWIYIEGDGWSDSIPLAVAEGMITLVEAIANAAGAPGLVDFIELLVDLQERIDTIAQGAVDEAAEGIKFYRGNVPASYTLNDLTPGAWGVASGTVAANLGIPVAATGTVVTTHTNYDGGKTALFTSSTQTTYYTRVWVNSTNNDGIWGRWQEVVTADQLSAYVSENEIPKNIAITGAASLDELADGKYQVRAPSEAEKWGLPARQAGWLEKLSFPGAILFRFTTNHVDDSVWPFQVWHRATNGSGVWVMPWVKTSPPEDRDISAQLADRPTFDWVNQQIASVDTQASFGTDPDGVPYVMIGE